jgi:hypothetical protein
MPIFGKKKQKDENDKSKEKEEKEEPQHVDNLDSQFAKLCHALNLSHDKIEGILLLY